MNVNGQLSLWVVQGANNPLSIKIQILRYVTQSLDQDMWHVWGKNRNAYRVMLGKPDRKWSLVAIGANRRIIMKCILTK